MSEIILSEKQEKIASFVTGSLLVKASAGSGKTRVLTERIKRLISISKRKVLAITFTNKASDEIRERLSDVENLNEKLYVGTFHSFCNYVLERHGNVLGYEKLPQIFSEDSDRIQIIEDVISQIPSFKISYEKKDEKSRRQFKSLCLETISKIKRNVILDEDLEKEIENKEIILLYLNYRKYLRALNAIDFDDLLLETYKLFLRFPNVASLYRRNFEYVCVDEAQDMNKAQYMLLKSFIGNFNPNIMLVGDEKQCIYGFIGSDSKYMIDDFINDYDPMIYELKENYRSSKKVLEYANKIIPDSAEINNTVLTGICEENAFSNQKEEAEFVASKIIEWTKIRNHPDIEGEITYKNFSVLARNRYVLSVIEDELSKLEIPYFYKNPQRQVELESLCGKIFQLGLTIKINPSDFFHIVELLSLLEIDENYSSLQEIIDNCSTLHSKVILEYVNSIKEDGSNISKSIERLKEEIKDSKEIINDEKILAFSDFDYIKKSWFNYAKSTNIKSLASFHNSLSLGQISSYEEKSGVALSTVHTMKGQENDIVFLIGMDDLTFPDYRAVRKGGIELQQEKNDLYVAITRAKRFLYISYPKNREMPWGGIYKRDRSRLLPSIN